MVASNRCEHACRLVQSSHQHVKVNPTAATSFSPSRGSASTRFAGVRTGTPSDFQEARDPYARPLPSISSTLYAPLLTALSHALFLCTHHSTNLADLLFLQLGSRRPLLIARSVQRMFLGYAIISARHVYLATSLRYCCRFWTITRRPLGYQLSSELRYSQSTSQGLSATSDTLYELGRPL